LYATGSIDSISMLEATRYQCSETPGQESLLIFHQATLSLLATGI